jgi:NADH:quinone reductase (non-electrogenic)
MIKTRFSELFGVARPIVQGGLQHLARAELAAAVANSGGLGQITAALFPDPAALQAEIRRCQSLTAKPFAVNFALGYRSMTNMLDGALAAGVRYISLTAGNPEPMIRHIRDAGLENEVKILVLVASVKTAQKAEAVGAHTVIAVGYEGGGHLGRDDIGTLVLTPLVVDAVKIPVLASGGIGDARGYAAALALGADGIEMGTRFIATQECVAHANYKNALVSARETDTEIIERSIGRPGRVLRGKMSAEILEVERDNPGIEKLLPYITGTVNYKAAVDGEMDAGFVWAGQVAGLIDDIPTVAELLDRLTDGATEILQRLARNFHS